MPRFPERTTWQESDDGSGYSWADAAHEVQDTGYERLDNLHDLDLADAASQTLERLRRELIDDRGNASHWTGTLSASALSTATAVSAMAALLISPGNDAKPDEARERLEPSLRCGIGYLRTQQRDDGGFGDTDRSHSNIATSYLALAATTLIEKALGAGSGLSAESCDRLRAYLVGEGELDGLRRRYGKDKTFVVPIMTNLAIAGLVDWKQIPALPFEAAVFPQSMYRFLRMPVVSYAVPALVAMGQARFLLGPKPWPPLRQIRNASINRTLDVLLQMQPDSGGYLEATPLTAFVLMSLAATHRGHIEVARRGLEFLVASMNPDGSWPIDTNLATWVTSLSVTALAKCGDDGDWCNDELIDWHLGCQHVERHPFTGADPGGWGWTDLSGAVPDGDDTPGAILALCRMRRHADVGRQQKIDRAIESGIDWLLGLQNRDGGWPTFCRGWGKLPFDRSSTDLTAHAIRAIAAYQSVFRSSQGLSSHDRRARELNAAVKNGHRFLIRHQQADGGWLPLWFGNQDHPKEENTIYGTSRVLLMLASESSSGRGDARTETAMNRAVCAFCDWQNDDGGWGGGTSRAAYEASRGDSEDANHSQSVQIESTVEETGLAIEALAEAFHATTGRGYRDSRSSARDPGNDPDPEQLMAAIIAGVKFLVDRINGQSHHHPWPIGFYFAKLWYHERLYPLVFATAALGAFQNISNAQAESHPRRHQDEVSDCPQD